MTKILILGGGFGGLYCAKKLEKIKLNSFDIELISNNNYFVYKLRANNKKQYYLSTNYFL